MWHICATVGDAVKIITEDKYLFFSHRFAFFKSANEVCVYRRKQTGFKPTPGTPCCIFSTLAPAEKKVGTGAGL